MRAASRPTTNRPEHQQRANTEGGVRELRPLQEPSPRLSERKLSDDAFRTERVTRNDEVLLFLSLHSSRDDAVRRPIPFCLPRLTLQGSAGKAAAPRPPRPAGGKSPGSRAPLMILCTFSGA